MREWKIKERLCRFYFESNHSCNFLYSILLRKDHEQGLGVKEHVDGSDQGKRIRETGQS